MIAARLFLAGPGLGLVAIGLAGARHPSLADPTWPVAAAFAQGALYFVAAWWVLARRTSPLPLVLLVAVLLRLTPLFSPPSLSDDAYRYVWDGRVQAAGINPYLHVPATPALAHLRDAAIYENVNRRDYAPTIYPPAAQLLFLATTRVSESITWMKITMVAAEALAVALLITLLRAAGQPPALVLLYAWHPLPVWEFAGNGHVDAAAIACMLAAILARVRDRPGLAGFALGVATLVKLYPLALLPALWRPRDFRLPAALLATVALGYLPYLDARAGVLGFLPGYLREEGLESGGRFWLVQVGQALGVRIPAGAYLAAAALFLGALSLYIALLRRPTDDFAGASLLVATAAVLAFSPHYAWYAAWLLPLAALAGSVPVLLFGVLSFVLYFEHAHNRLLVESLLYVPSGLFALLWVWMRRSGARGRAATEIANA